MLRPFIEPRICEPARFAGANVLPGCDTEADPYALVPYRSAASRPVRRILKTTPPTTHKSWSERMSSVVADLVDSRLCQCVKRAVGLYGNLTPLGHACSGRAAVDRAWCVGRNRRDVWMVSVWKHGSKWQVRWRNAAGRQVIESFDRKRKHWISRRRSKLGPSSTGRRRPWSTPETPATLAKWWARWEPGRPWVQSSRDTHDLHWRRFIQPAFGEDAAGRHHAPRCGRRGTENGEGSNCSSGDVASIHRTLSMTLQGAGPTTAVLAVNRLGPRVARWPKSQALRSTPRPPPCCSTRLTRASLKLALSRPSRRRNWSPPRRGRSASPGTVSTSMLEPCSSTGSWTTTWTRSSLVR